jgi:ribosomal protein S18 acetylase RimI-like enzyme
VLDQLRSLTIRPLGRRELRRLEQRLPRPRGKHAERLERQRRGHGVYLVAWEDREPVGHVLLSWVGRAGCPEIQDLAVAPPYRQRGVATRLMDEAERAAAARAGRVGLSVGIDNTVARRLYDARGYRTTADPPFTISYPTLGELGDIRMVEETCVYMLKPL